MLAIDTSGSMAATDVPPTRLQAAQGAARNFVERHAQGVEGRSVAIRHDRTPARAADGRPPDRHDRDRHPYPSATGPPPASAITLSLEAINALPADAEGKKAPAAIVLMSDGSPTVGENGMSAADAVAAATQAAKKAGVPVDTIVFGTNDGTVSRGGQTISVPADPSAMARIASGTGGKSFTAKSGSELGSVYTQIRKTVGYDTVKHDITEWFLALGLLLALATSAAGLYWMQRVP